MSRVIDSLRKTGLAVTPTTILVVFGGRGYPNGHQVEYVVTLADLFS